MDYKFILSNGDEVTIDGGIITKVSVTSDGAVIAWNETAEVVFAASPGGWQYFYRLSGNGTEVTNGAA